MNKRVRCAPIFNMDLHKPILQDSGPMVIPIKENRKTTFMVEFLNVHYKFKFQHIYFKRMKKVPKQGIISRKFRSMDIRVYYACIYSKATKKK